MSNTISILIVEDNMIIGAKVSMLLTELGYEVAGIIPRAEEALLNIENNPPDILLLDIHLKGNMDGIELAHQMQVSRDIPIIYLTSNSDEKTFDRAKKTRPFAFISKPYKKLDLQRAVELTLSRMADKNTEAKSTPQDESPFILSDRIFVRHKDKMVKVFIHDILFVEADRNYCMVHTTEKEFLLTVPLKVLEGHLPDGKFMRVHRSFVVNLGKIDALADNHEYLVFGQKNVPVSRRFKEAVVKRLRLI